MTDGDALRTPPQPSPGALRAVAILLMAQGAVRLLFLAYTMTVVLSVVRSGSGFWSDNPAFVATSVLSLALGLAAIAVGAGIVQRQPWARTLGVAVCAAALLGEAYVAFNLASNFARLDAFSRVLYSGLTAIYTGVFVLSLTVLVRWRPTPANTQLPWPSAE